VVGRQEFIAMSTDTNQAIIRRVFEDYLNAGDMAVPAEVISPDFVDHNPMPGQPAGSDALLYVYNTLHDAHSDMSITIDEMLAEDDKVAVRWTLRGINTGEMFGMPPTHQQTTMEVIVIFRLADGKVTDRWAQMGGPSI